MKNNKNLPKVPLLIEGTYGEIYVQGTNGNLIEVSSAKETLWKLGERLSSPVYLTEDFFFKEKEDNKNTAKQLRKV